MGQSPAGHESDFGTTGYAQTPKSFIQFSMSIEKRSGDWGAISHTFGGRPGAAEGAEFGHRFRGIYTYKIWRVVCPS